MKPLNAYLGLMEEASYRLLAMDTALEGRTGLPPGAIKEYCFLQLRMLCELIALGCLTAHGDLQTGKLKDAYEADKIIRRLQRLHPDFYPIAAIRTDKGPRLYEDGFLTKEALTKLYWRCGDVLHRGSSRPTHQNNIRLRISKRLEPGRRRLRPLAVMAFTPLATNQ
jgi:hypothetical protein